MNISKEARAEMLEMFVVAEKLHPNEEQVIENAKIYTELVPSCYETLTDLCEDCNTLESEVERLREENETLKKRMEDDLK